jgi:hypothetical protein
MAEGDIVIPRQQFKDRFTRIDELLELLIAKPAGEVTVEIPALPDPLPVDIVNPLPIPTAIVNPLPLPVDIFNSIPLGVNILNPLPLPVIFDFPESIPVTFGPPEDPFILAYPFDGTYATIAAGTTTINFKVGAVRSPLAVITPLSGSLDKAKKDFMRSVVVDADRAVVIQLDSRDKAPAKAGSFSVLEDTEFETLYITATEDTTIYIAASTNPKSVITLSGAGVEAVKSSIKDGRKVVATAGTRLALAASTTCKHVTIVAETNNTDIVVVGGITVVAALATRQGVPLYPGDTYDLDIDDLADVYLDALVSTEGVTYTYFN